MVNNWSKIAWIFKDSKIKIFLLAPIKIVDSILFFFYFTHYFFSVSGLILLKELIICSFFEFILMFLIAFNCLSILSRIAFNCCSFLPSIFFSIFNDPSFFSSYYKLLFTDLLNGEYSNIACSTKIFTSQIFIVVEIIRRQCRYFSWFFV